jgi:hypothetical protein
MSSHGDRGNERVFRVGSVRTRKEERSTLVPTLCVVTQVRTLCVPPLCATSSNWVDPQTKNASYQALFDSPALKWPHLDKNFSDCGDFV